MQQPGVYVQRNEAVKLKGSRPFDKLRVTNKRHGELVEPSIPAGVYPEQLEGRE